MLTIHCSGERFEVRDGEGVVLFTGDKLECRAYIAGRFRRRPTSTTTSELSALSAEIIAIASPPEHSQLQRSTFGQVLRRPVAR